MKSTRTPLSKTSFMRHATSLMTLAALIYVGCIDDATVTIPSTSVADPVDSGPDLANEPDAGDDMRADRPRDMSAAVDLGDDDMGEAIEVDMVSTVSEDMPVDMAPEPPPRCSALPLTCDGLDPGAQEHHIVANGDGCAFALARTGEADMEETLGVIDALAAAGKGYAAIDQLSLNREARLGLTADAADRLKNHDHWGFRWNSGDMATESWYPQGITGSEDAFEDGGRRRIIVSWYDHDDADGIVKGARISIVDLEDPSDMRYRHVLLAVPTGSVTTPDFEAVVTGSGAPLHAGGIVWLGDLLYVADTTQGFRVFDLSRIIEVTDTDDTDKIGLGAARMDAHGYRYIAPQVARYRLHSDSCRVRFSFVSLDRSTTPPRLLSGEYRKDDTGGRLVSWPVASDSDWLAIEADGLAHATRAYVSGQTKMQGAMSWGNAIYISSSSQYNGYGRIYRTRVGQKSNITAWVRGAEDLYYERSTNRVWTPAEYPDARDVASIPRQEP